MTIERVLFLRFSAIGDVILISPLLRIFFEAYPHTKIDVLVKDKFSSLLAYHPLVNEVIIIPDKPSFWDLIRIIQKLRRFNYDIIFDLQKHWRSYFISFFCGTSSTYRYKKFSFKRFFLVYFKKNLYKGIPESVPLRYFLAFHKLNIGWKNCKPEIYYTESIQKKANSLLPSDNKNNLIALAPGGGRKTKRWLSKYYIELINMLQTSFKLNVLLLGGVDDKSICDEIENGLNNRITNLSGQTTLLETAAVLQHCQMIICNDTGLMHMAAALDRKIVAIFGPTVVEFGFFPFTDKFKVVEHESLDCRPCSYHGTDTCPKKHFNCMKEISPDRVFQVVKNLQLEIEKK